MKPPALAFNAARPESGGAEKHAGARADAAGVLAVLQELFGPGLGKLREAAASQTYAQ